MFTRSFVLFILLFGGICESKPIGHFLKTTVENEAVKVHRINGQSIRPLHVSSSDFEPFMYQDSHGEFHNGIEYNLLKIIAEKVQMNLSFKPHFHRSNYDQLMLNNSDIIVGGIFPNRVSFDVLSVSKPYYQDEFIWCVQRAKNIHWLLSFFLIASPDCWIIYIFGIGYTAGFLFYLLIQFDLKYKQRNQRDWHYTTWLISLPTVIGITSEYRPKRFSSRLFYGYMLFVSMLAWQRLFYQGVRFIKIPVQYHQPSTVTEIVDYEFRLSGSSDVLDLISFDERYKKSQLDSYFVCPNLDDCLEHLKHDDNDDLAVGGSRQRILNSRSYSASKIFCFDRDESIASYQPALLMRKDNALRKRIDDIIQNAFEGGLFVKWERDSQQKKERIMPFIPPLELTMKHVSPAFVFFIFAGALISFVSCISELIIHRNMKQTQRSWIWKYLEQFFDGNRHYLKNLPEQLTRRGGHRMDKWNLFKSPRIDFKC